MDIMKIQLMSNVQIYSRKHNFEPQELALMISQVLTVLYYSSFDGRLLKKSKNGDFSNFAYNEINNLQTTKS